MLRSLWDSIAFRVRTQLVALGVPSREFGGVQPLNCVVYDFMLLVFIRQKLPKPNGIPDRYVSSYTPSLFALLKARSGLVIRTTGNPNLLVIAQPDETLPMVTEEIGHSTSLE